MEADFRLGMRCAFFQGAGAHVTYFHVFNKPYFLWPLHFYCHTSVHIDTLLDKYVYLLLLLAEELQRIDTASRGYVAVGVWHLSMVSMLIRE